MISFRVGANDAKYLAREFYPVFEEVDIVNLPNYNIYLKLLIDGISSKPFSAVTLSLPEKEEKSNKSKVINSSRDRYAVLERKSGVHRVSII
jgi:hypothetical protein